MHSNSADLPFSSLVESVPDLDLEIQWFPQFISCGQEYFETLRNELPWRSEKIQIFGRSMPIPRLQSWHGEREAKYRYSQLDLTPEPWTKTLLEIRERLRQHRPDVEFNSVLANLYRDGRDSMGWHSDDEPELGPEPVIASLSFGATRPFRFRHKTRRELKPISLDLPSGSLLWMEGKTQEQWLHCLPKRTGKNDPGPRINLTFRQIFPLDRR